MRSGHSNAGSDIHILGIARLYVYGCKKTMRHVPWRPVLHCAYSQPDEDFICLHHARSLLRSRWKSLHGDPHPV